MSKPASVAEALLLRALRVLKLGEAMSEPGLLVLDLFRVTTARQADAQHMLETDARRENICNILIELGVFPVPKDDTFLGIQEDQSFGKHFDGPTQARMCGSGLALGSLGFCLGFEVCLFPGPAFGDILEGRDPAAAFHRPVRNRDDAAVAQIAVDLQGAMPLQLGAVSTQQLLCGGVRMVPESDRMFEDLAHGHAWLHDLRRKAIEFKITVVEQREPHVLVEHAQALGHVVQRGGVSQVLGTKGLVTRLDTRASPLALGARVPKGTNRAPAFAHDTRPRDHSSELPMVTPYAVDPSKPCGRVA